MKLQEWIQQKRKDPRFLAASEEIAFAQDLADYLVRLRVRTGLTQADLARRAGTTQASISRLEAGIANPTLSKIARIIGVLREADAVATSIADLSAEELMIQVTLDTTVSQYITGEFEVPPKPGSSVLIETGDLSGPATFPFANEPLRRSA